MIVQSFDRYGEVSDLDPATGELTPAAGPPAEAHGHYATLGGVPVILYRRAGTLLLRIGPQVLPIDDTTTVRHVERGPERALEITGAATAQVRYPAPDTVVAYEDDPTPFAEPEDFDFGLFVATIANHPERRALIYTGQ